MSAVLQSDRLWSINHQLGYPVEWFYQAEALRKAVPRDSHLCIFINDNTGTIPSDWNPLSGLCDASLLNCLRFGLRDMIAKPASQLSV